MPDAAFGKLWDRVVAGSLPALASHPIANFVVQAAITCARTPDQVLLISMSRNVSWHAMQQYRHDRHVPM